MNTKRAKNILYHHMIQNRLKLILHLIREGRDVTRIEREAALLSFDVVDAIGKTAVPSREGCQCFIAIEYALDQKIRNRLSQEFEDLVNEGMLLDEIGRPHGTDLNLLTRLATKILVRGAPLGKKSAVRTPVGIT